MRILELEKENTMLKAHNRTMRKILDLYGGIPDDGSLHWYLHEIIGKTVTPAICQEITKRAKSNVQSD